MRFWYTFFKFHSIDKKFIRAGSGLFFILWTHTKNFIYIQGNRKKNTQISWDYPFKILIIHNYVNVHVKLGFIL
jgi:hypothetical protein